MELNLDHAFAVDLQDSKKRSSIASGDDKNV